MSKSLISELGERGLEQ